ncbi:MAG: type II toxin-antitoxin system ParD family antitoxin [Hyphomonadaceae bacterium]|nr:type II toxin-antitoxin system ParD family antitoxin [Hyphomonadaceae bacterium]
MATRNINLTDALDRFVADQIASGNYQNASEVIRTALRLLKSEEDKRAAKLALLRAAVQEGLDSIARGEGVEVTDIDAHFDELEADIDAQLDAENAKEPAAAK